MGRCSDQLCQRPSSVVAIRALDCWVEGYQNHRTPSDARVGKPGLRLRQLAKTPEDPDPKALCCNGLLRADTGQLLVRFVDGRPVSQVTLDFLDWTCGRLILIV